MQLGDYDEAEAILTACTQMHEDQESPSFLKVQELLELVKIRKDASEALKRLSAQEVMHSVSSLLKQPKIVSNDSSSLKSPIRVRSTKMTNLRSSVESISTQQFSESVSNADISANDIVPQNQPFPSALSTRSRPAYASAGKALETISLDPNIVIAWADYIEQHSIPRDAPSIPLSLNVGITIPPGFEIHYKVAAFALVKSRKQQSK